MVEAPRQGQATGRGQWLCVCVCGGGGVYRQLPPRGEPGNAHVPCDSVAKAGNRLCGSCGGVQTTEAASIRNLASLDHYESHESDDRGIGDGPGRVKIQP